jgi:ABC-type nitrate/sulfonate/bicarbonate transport system substrate-binding protein
MSAIKFEPIKVVPHFMRLHEWIALEENFFEPEGLSPELRAEDMEAISSHGADPYLARPQDKPYLEGEQVCSSACHWAVPMNAGAGMGKFVPDLYGVARYAIVVREGSRIERLSQLRDVPVGVGLMAGSHFSTITALETVLPKERIKIENIGGPGRRLAALLAGEIEAATLLDPEIAMAEQKGLRKIAQGEFKTLFWVMPTIKPEVLDAYFRVMRRAEAALQAAPQRYMHLWARNLPKERRGESYDLGRFGLGEILVFEPYTQAEYEQTLKLAERWGLAKHLREGAHVIDNIAMHVSV